MARFDDDFFRTVQTPQALDRDQIFDLMSMQLQHRPTKVDKHCMTMCMTLIVCQVEEQEMMTMLTTHEGDGSISFQAFTAGIVQVGWAVKGKPDRTRESLDTATPDHPLLQVSCICQRGSCCLCKRTRM